MPGYSAGGFGEICSSFDKVFTIYLGGEEYHETDPLIIAYISSSYVLISVIDILARILIV
jgi:hypothetical protein